MGGLVRACQGTGGLRDCKLELESESGTNDGMKALPTRIRVLWDEVGEYL